jgi:hypothetical protein
MYGEIEEGVQNKVPYFGAGSKNPAADIVHTYLNGIGRAVADKRYIDAMKPLGTTMKQRIQANPYVREAYQRVQVATKRVSNFAVAGNHIITARKGAPVDTISMDAMGRLSPELRDKLASAMKLSKAKGPPGTKGAAATKLRTEAFDDVQKVFQNLRDSAVDKKKFLKEERKIAAETVRNPKGFVRMAEAEFSGRLFPVEQVEGLAPFISTPRDIFGVAGEKALGAVANVSSVARSAQLTFDVGAGFLQGAMVLFNSPRSWTKAMFKSLHSLGQPSQRLKYLAQDDTKKVFSIFQGRLHIGSTEFTEALREGGAAARWMTNIPVVGKSLTSAAQRFQNSYEVFFDVSRLEMAKAFIPAIEKGTIRADQVANQINKMTGVISSRGLGVSATQRQIESAAISLAPQ